MLTSILNPQARTEKDTFGLCGKTHGWRTEASDKKTPGSGWRVAAHRWVRMINPLLFPWFQQQQKKKRPANDWREENHRLSDDLSSSHSVLEQHLLLLPACVSTYVNISFILLLTCSPSFFAAPLIPLLLLRRPHTHSQASERLHNGGESEVCDIQHSLW